MNKMVDGDSILTESGGELRFSRQIREYILDENMQLKAVRLRNGEVIDAKHLHRRFTPTHPLLKTPARIKQTLDQFFVYEFRERRLPATI
jgi:hypothetical protein